MNKREAQVVIAKRKEEIYTKNPVKSLINIASLSSKGLLGRESLVEILLEPNVKKSEDGKIDLIGKKRNLPSDKTIAGYVYLLENEEYIAISPTRDPDLCPNDAIAVSRYAIRGFRELVGDSY